MSTKIALGCSNVGVPGTGVDAEEFGDRYNHTTVLTIDAANSLTVADNAAIADGHLIYTFPAGSVIVNSAYMSVAVSVGSDQLIADTPDVGIGTVTGSGAVATLDGTATFENIITGQTAADSNGTATVKTSIPTAAVPLVIETGAAHTVYLNVADTWANDTDGDLTADLSGTVIINWTAGE